MLMAFGMKASAQDENTYVTMYGDTLKVGQTIQLMNTSGCTDSYKFVYLLNNMNNPLQPAKTNIVLRKEEIIKFKDYNGVIYAITKFMGFQPDMALLTKEIRVVK